MPVKAAHLIGTQPREFSFVMWKWLDILELVTTMTSPFIVPKQQHMRGDCIGLTLQNTASQQQKCPSYF
ncbi:hypothetical protein SprV_0301268500 [Sparganum proliferum]